MAVRLSGVRFCGRGGHEEGVQNLAQRHGCGDADDRGEGEHQSDHDTSEVRGQDGVDDNEDLLVFEVAEAHVHTGREQPDQHVQVEEERGPGSRLMLGDGCDDGDVDLGVAGVPERVETTRPGGDSAGDCEQDQPAESDGKDDKDHAAEQGLELFGRELITDILREANELDKTKNA